jgi:formyltetrahydrofolate-dependent phosphoribosylglycinamide formyltransferase
VKESGSLLQIAVFASGKGSNLEAILRAIEFGKLPHCRIAVVISNNANAGALDIARIHAIPALHLSRQLFSSAEEFTDALLRALRGHGVNFIALAGYMKKVSPAVISEYRNRIVNIHPALLPQFGGQGMFGMHVHEAVIASGAKTSGATVHLVDDEYDRGPIVLQRTVPVIAGDTPESLAARVLTVEHELYPEALKLFAERRVSISGHHITIAGTE